MTVHHNVGHGPPVVTSLSSRRTDVSICSCSSVRGASAIAAIDERHPRDLQYFVHDLRSTSTANVHALSSSESQSARSIAAWMRRSKGGSCSAIFLDAILVCIDKLSVASG